MRLFLSNLIQIVYSTNYVNGSELHIQLPSTIKVVYDHVLFLFKDYAEKWSTLYNINYANAGGVQ